MAAISGRSWSLTDNGEPARVDGEAVSASLFPLLQIDAAIGRVFTADEDRQGAARVVAPRARSVDASASARTPASSAGRSA